MAGSGKGERAADGGNKCASPGSDQDHPLLLLWNRAAEAAVKLEQWTQVRSGNFPLHSIWFHSKSRLNRDSFEPSRQVPGRGEFPPGGPILRKEGFVGGGALRSQEDPVHDKVVVFVGGRCNVRDEGETAVGVPATDHTQD